MVGGCRWSFPCAKLAEFFLWKGKTHCSFILIQFILKQSQLYLRVPFTIFFFFKICPEILLKILLRAVQFCNPLCFHNAIHIRQRVGEKLRFKSELGRDPSEMGIGIVLCWIAVSDLGPAMIRSLLHQNLNWDWARFARGRWKVFNPIISQARVVKFFF